jgi:hypothetical protein
MSDQYGAAIISIRNILAASTARFRRSDEIAPPDHSSANAEQAYGQVLNDLLREADRPVHLEVVSLNPGAGDPIARLRKAEQEIVRRRQRRSAFGRKMVLMDSDQVDGDIKQEPCHEALLLRHLDGFAHKRPPTSGIAIAMLKTVWPDYRKPMTKIQLAKRVDLAAIRRAAAAESALFAFLQEITLLP